MNYHFDVCDKFMDPRGNTSVLNQKFTKNSLDAKIKN